MIMLIRLRSTGEVIADTVFMALHDNVSFPSPLRQQDVAEFDADIVLDGVPLTSGQFQSVVEDGVEQIDGQWVTKFKVVNWPQEQIDAYTDTQKQSVRHARNQKLKDSDWTQGKDIAGNISTAWAAYRQALRDVPAQAGFPWEVQWPNKPE